MSGCPNVSLAAAPPAAYVRANAAVAAVYTAYVLATLAAWWALSRRHVALRKRSLTLVALSAAGGWLMVLQGPLRAAVGAATFPCALLLWAGAGTTVVTVAPMVLYLARFYDAYTLNVRLAAVDAASLHRAVMTSATPRRVTRAASVRFRYGPSDVADTASVSPSTDGSAATGAALANLLWRAGDAHVLRLMAAVCAPVVVATVALNAAVPYYAPGCVGCEIGLLAFGVFLTEGLYLFALGAWFAYKVRALPDPLGIVRDLVLALSAGGAVGFPGFVLVVADPGGLYADKIVNWQWLLCLACAAFHTVLCTANVVRAALGRDRLPAHGSLEDFRRLLGDPAVRAAFRDYCASEWAAENLRFLDAVALYKATTPKARAREAAFVVAAFVQPDAPLQINIPHRMRLATEEAAAGQPAPDADCFDAAAAEVVRVLYQDTFPRFLHTAAAAELGLAGAPGAHRPPAASAVVVAVAAAAAAA